MKSAQYINYRARKTSSDCQGPPWTFPLLEEPEDRPIWGLTDVEI